MEGFFVLKDLNSGKYYSNDKEFIEPNKKFAKKLRFGQAKAIQFESNRWCSKLNVELEDA